MLDKINVVPRRAVFAVAVVLAIGSTRLTAVAAEEPAVAAAADLNAALPEVAALYNEQTGSASPLGQLWTRLFGHGLAFSFDGLLVASVLINLPFAVQPMQRAFEALPPDVREAAWVSGLTPW